MSPEFYAKLAEAADMFLFLATELIILFLVISYLVGVLQEFLTPEKIQSILSSRKGKGYIVAAFLGAITPFCSCSTIPFLKGLLRARAGFGPMMVFLFSSPLLNPVIIGLFVITFGIKVAAFYFVVAMAVSVSAGYLLEKLGFERYVKPEAYEVAGATTSCCGDSKPAASSCCDSQPAAKPEPAVSCCAGAEPQVSVDASGCGTASACAPAQQVEENRWMRLWRATWKDFKQVFPYLMLGISLGAFIYGFIPTDLIAQYAGEGNWYAIPVAAVIGIPLYIRAEAVIPLSSALVAKGMALGSVMALIIGSAGASLTEVILLKSIFRNQMIAAFVTVILTMAIGAGVMYSVLFG